MNSCSYRKSYYLGFLTSGTAGTLPLVGQEAVTVTSSPPVDCTHTASACHPQRRHTRWRLPTRQIWAQGLQEVDGGKEQIHRRTFVMTEVARVWLSVDVDERWEALGLVLPAFLPPCAPCSGPGEDDPARSIIPMSWLLVPRRQNPRTGCSFLTASHILAPTPVSPPAPRNFLGHCSCSSPHSPSAATEATAQKGG